MPFYTSLVTCLFVLGCPVASPPAFRKPVYPNKNLKEIIVYGTYSLENKEELEKLKKNLLINERCDPSDRSTRCKYHSLNVGETLEEALKTRFLGIGEEGFGYSQYKEYCYNETDENDKKPVFRKNLKARLYDKEGNLLSEDFLRWGGRTIPESQNVISYLPYHDNGYKIRVVKLEGKKEVILNEKIMVTQEKLREISYVDNEITNSQSWVFNHFGVNSPQLAAYIMRR